MEKIVKNKKNGTPGTAGEKVSVEKAALKTNKTVKKASKSAKTPSADKKQSRTKKTARKPLPQRNISSVHPPQPEKLPLKLKTYLKKAELDHFRTLLIDKLKEITGNVNHIEKEFLQKSRQDATGDLSSMPIHMADIGSDNYEQEFTLGLMATEQKIVQEILLALRRIDDGSYGMCEGTGEPIPKARLEAFPWARYCVRYAEMIEKGQVAEDRKDNYSNRGYTPSAVEAEEDDETVEDDKADDDDDDGLDFDEQEDEEENER